MVHTYRFAGAYYDTATGLYKMGARYYDPYVGRFTQRDPFPASAYEPRNYNRYIYVADNPINYTDPLGYWPWDNWRKESSGPCLPSQFRGLHTDIIEVTNGLVSWQEFSSAELLS